MQNPQNTKFVSPAFNNQDPYYSTVAAAINAAASGSMIMIFPGTYNEIISTTKRLQLVGTNKHV